MHSLRSLILVIALLAALVLRADPATAPDLSFLPRTAAGVEIVGWDGYSYVDSAGHTYWSGAAEPSAADLDAALATLRTPPAPAAPAPVWSALAFFERFTEGEQLAIFASEDAAVRLFRAKLLAAQEVRADDPRVVAGLDLLVAQGLLTPARKAAILAP